MPPFTVMPTLSPSSSVDLLRDAVQHHRRISRRGLLERLFTHWFRGFVYNQIWEDPHVDMEALQLNGSSRIVTIASGGCNVLNYLTRNPARVVALDVNPAHMALTRLKLAALAHLPSHDAFYDFFGRGNQAVNIDRYCRYLRPGLDPSTRRYWERPMLLGRRRIHVFEDGLYAHGRLGRFLGLMHAVARLQGKRPDALLEATSIREQERVFEAVVVPLFRSQLVRWIARRPMTVFSLGIPPQQHHAMNEDAHDIVALYLERLRKLACGFPIEDNYFAWQVFGRRYDHARRRAVPDYLRREHFEALRGRHHRVETQVASYQHYLADQSDGAFDRFVLLDAQDWMPAAKIEAMWREIARVGALGSRIIFRTAGTASPVEAVLPDSLRRQFVYDRATSERLHAQDRSAIYGMFHRYVLTG